SPLTDPGDFRILSEDASTPMFSAAKKMWIGVSVAAYAAGTTAISLKAFYLAVKKFPLLVKSAAISTITSFTIFVLAREYAAVQAKQVAELTGILEYILDVKTQGVVTFPKDAIITIGTQGEFRTIMQEDSKSSIAPLKKVVTSDNDLIEADNEISE